MNFNQKQNTYISYHIFDNIARLSSYPLYMTHLKQNIKNTEAFYDIYNVTWKTCPGHYFAQFS
jgi:hypothetical protein